jgi:beta-glucosidase
VDELTLEEKAALTSGRGFWHLHGIERVGIPSILVCDGPHGLRKQRSTEGFDLDSVPATCFPTASALAATWDVDLVQRVGVALGEEARAESVSVLLGPGVNIKRSALCGRNFEYFSEDPHLSSRMGAAWVRGVQSTGVGASLKHFAVNNQEYARWSVNALVDERALREIYLPSFEYVVTTEHPATVMAAYNQCNGDFCCENAELLTRILRDEWGFDGVTVSDWGACYDRIASLRAGLDLQMPGFEGSGDHDIVAAVRDGSLPAEALDRAAVNIANLIDRTAQARIADASYDQPAHHELARRTAAAGMVLLRNEGGLLPLPEDAGTVAVIGAFARTPRYQGAGSSGINPHRLENLMHELSLLLPAERLSYADGYRRDRIEPDEELLAEARTVAAAADVAVVVVGLPEAYETEGLDRTHLDLPPAHNALVAAVAAANPRTVVVLCNGAPVLMPWSGAVPAILEAYLGGEAAGGAVADVLLGVAEPGGRLAETLPLRLTDHPAHTSPNGPRHVAYAESIYIGYRFYDSAGVDVAFPFGHGLSYTTFVWTPARLSSTLLADGESLDVSLTVTNTGDRAGSDVVQVYVRDLESTVFRPDQELAGFAKVHLQPGESSTVRIRLNRRAFAFWDTIPHEWYVEPGAFEIRVGASSRDIRSVARVAIDSTEPERRLNPGPAVYHRIHLMRTFDEASFATLYGSPLPTDAKEQPGSYTINTRIADMRSPIVSAFRSFMRRRAAAMVKGQEDSIMAVLMNSMLDETTPRMLPLISQGAMGPAAAVAFTRMANGETTGGFRALLRARRADRKARKRSVSASA